ncbi:retrovirus-related pol polyprotein from transposon TNT 1-94 [Tanacetum coccineum]
MKEQAYNKDKDQEQDSRTQCQSNSQEIQGPCYDVNMEAQKSYRNLAPGEILCSKYRIVQLILFIVDSGCTKHMTDNLTLLCNFVEKYLGTVRFGNDQFAQILGYGYLVQGNITVNMVYYVEGLNHNLFSVWSYFVDVIRYLEDLVQGNITINRVYYVEGLNHNLFSVGQFCEADLEVAFRNSTCFVRVLQGNDLLTASLTQAWLLHRRLSHLNFDYINLLSKKDVMIGLPKLKYVKDQLCSPCEVGKAKKKFIQDKDYYFSRYTWTLCLRSKDETTEVLKDFLTMIQKNLQSPVISVRTNRGTEFLNKTLNAFFKEEGIEYQTSTPRTPKQNDVVKIRNRTLVEAARTMLSAYKLSLFFWAEAIATVCSTQNRSIIIPKHEKMAYHIINDRKPLIKHLHIFGCTYTTSSSQQELDLLFGPLYDEFFKADTSRINKSFSPTDNSAQQDTQPSMNIHPTTEPSTPTNVH